MTTPQDPPPDADLGPDAALVQALSQPLPGQDAAQLLDIDELAARTGIPVAVLEAFEREGFIAPRLHDGAPRYTGEDASALSSGMSLLSAGVPLDELLGLARGHDAAMRSIASEAVDLFIRFVRDPIQGSSESTDEASQRLVAAFREMLPAAADLVAHHFRRLLLDEAIARIDGQRDGGPPG